MINLKILLLLAILFLIPLITDNSFAQKIGGFGDSPFERDFGDVKFSDAYFGVLDHKIEVEPGDQNVPFTVIFSNVGTLDITGIKGQLSLPFGFSAANGQSSLIIGNSESNALAGQNFNLTFFVNIDKNVKIQQYPGTVKVDFSRLRESGVRSVFSDFNFKVTGKSVINVEALDPFLTSLKSNNVIIQIANNGTGPMYNVNVLSTKKQSENTSDASLEKVVVLGSNWSIGNIAAKSSRTATATVYVPGNVKETTLRVPLTVTYYDGQGLQQSVDKIINFYIKGLTNLTIYDVDVMELSNKQMVIGEVINEGNEDALFGFVTLEPLGNSNIKKQTQFIDEIDTDSPVPFNIPIEFNGEPRYGEHEIKLTVRYKDSVRDEVLVTHNSTIFIKAPPIVDTSANNLQLLIIPVIIAIGIGIYGIRRRKKLKNQTQ